MGKRQIIAEMIEIQLKQGLDVMLCELDYQEILKALKGEGTKE